MTTNVDPLIGQKLSNFRIERVLGRGGMAQVYYGQDVKLQRPVAIKVIDARYRGKPAYALRFIKEAQAIARWRHENIIQIYYADDQDGLYYYVMEYIDGQDLGDLMSSHASWGDLLSPPQIIKIGRSIASALDYAHSQGIIHRDVKPSNILISREGRVIISDFGLALDMQLGSSGEAFGTPNYISPEQARRSTDAVPQSDLYSLGVILYEMLTGVVPFDDPSPTSIALQHITQAPPLPRSINPQISIETETVLLKALSKDPKDRYQTGAELMEALENSLFNTKPVPELVLPLPPMPAAIVAGKTRSVTRKVTPVSENVGGTDKKRRWRLVLALLVVIFLLGFLAVGSGLRPAAISAMIFPPPSATPTMTQISPLIPATSATALPKNPVVFPVESVSVTSSPSPYVGAAGIMTGTVTAIDLPSETATGTPTRVVETLTFTPTLTLAVTITPTATLAASATSTPAIATSTPAIATSTPAIATSTSVIATPTKPATTATSIPATATPIPAAATSTLVGPLPDGDATPTATTTQVYLNYKRLWMYYDQYGFYIYNASDANRSISPIALERLDQDGNPLPQRFEGWRWADYYPTLHPQRCMRIEVQKNPNAYLKPPLCKNYYLSTRSLAPAEIGLVFWTATPDSTQFRVLWKNEFGKYEVVGKCEMAAGFCEVFVP